MAGGSICCACPIGIRASVWFPYSLVESNRPSLPHSQALFHGHLNHLVLVALQDLFVVNISYPFHFLDEKLSSSIFSFRHFFRGHGVDYLLALPN